MASNVSLWLNVSLIPNVCVCVCPHPLVFAPLSVCTQAGGQTLCPHTSDSGGSAPASSAQRCPGEALSVQHGT